MIGRLLSYISKKPVMFSSSLSALFCPLLIPDPPLALFLAKIDQAFYHGNLVKNHLGRFLIDNQRASIKRLNALRDMAASNEHLSIVQ